jgi:hypothetical protein
MALGTITKPTPTPDHTIGNKRVRVRDVVLTGGANYTTGGETISPAAVGMKLRIEQCYSTGQARTTSGGAATIPVSVDFATTPGSAKLQAYVAASGAEQSAAANLSTFSIRLTFVGV